MSQPPLFHIAFPTTDAPTGGGNQFLRALGRELGRRGQIAADGARADVVLFNSYQEVPAAVTLRRANPDAVFVHRVDGPMRLYNRPDDPRDGLAMEANALIADATVFQTRWCREANRELGWAASGPEAVIGNAADPNVFRRRAARLPAGRVRVIATSWSSNPNKGFDAYSWLDSNLDFARFEMTFVGNSPVGFASIRSLAPMDSPGLAAELGAHDVFLTASRKDPCSNSLIEALTIGLPAVARADGGHPELMGGGGLLFADHAEIPGLLECVAREYETFHAGISVPSIGTIADDYDAFARELVDMRRAGRLEARRPGLLAAARVRWRFRGR